MRVLAVVLLLLPTLSLATEWSAKPLSEIALYPEFRIPAAVHARDEAGIAAELSARILAMPVREGEAVARGAVLVRLDDAAYRIELERARAQRALVDSRIELARAQLAQARALAARGFISADGLRIRETEVGVLESERAAAAASVASAELALARCVVRAPYAGVVRSRSASVGDLASPGMPLLTLAASDEVEVRARVPASQVEAFERAQAWRLHVGDAAHELSVRRISPVVETAGQVREAVLVAASALAPGLAGELRWRSTDPHLPAAYLQQREGVLGAWVVRDGQPQFMPLPQAQAGRPLAVDWPLATELVDDGRFALDLHAERAAEAQ